MVWMGTTSLVAPFSYFHFYGIPNTLGFFCKRHHVVISHPHKIHLARSVAVPIGERLTITSYLLRVQL